MTMPISKSAARRVAKKPSPRKQRKTAKTKKAMPLRTADPVRTSLVKSKRNGAEPMTRKRGQRDGGVRSSSNSTLMPSNGLMTLLIQWSPLGLFLRQQAFLADVMGHYPKTTFAVK
jgi:hypothetical protein